MIGPREVLEPAQGAPTPGQPEPVAQLVHRTSGSTPRLLLIGPGSLRRVIPSGHGDDLDHARDYLAALDLHAPSQPHVSGPPVPVYRLSEVVPQRCPRWCHSCADVADERTDPATGHTVLTHWGAVGPLPATGRPLRVVLTRRDVLSVPARLGSVALHLPPTSHAHDLTADAADALAAILTDAARTAREDSTS